MTINPIETGMNSGREDFETQPALQKLKTELTNLTEDRHPEFEIRDDTLVMMADFAYGQTVRKYATSVFETLKNDPSFTNVARSYSEIHGELTNPLGPINKIIIALSKDE